MSRSSPVHTRKLLPSNLSDWKAPTVNGPEAPSDDYEPKESFYKRYRVLGLIGGGAFGDVYLAVQEQEHVSRYVAIKVLNRQSLRPRGIALLLQEARVMGSIHHRLFPKLIDLIHFRHQWALVMEWVPGVSLSRLCRESGRVPVSVALEIVADLANGVHALHTRLDAFGGPVAHCDIKPANIRIGPHGSVRLMDLGSASAFRSGRVASTLPYAAPELYSGLVTPAADVFSMGVTLLTLLTLPPDEEVRTQEHADCYREHHLHRFPRATDREVTGLVRRMLDPTHTDRPSVQQVEVSCRRMRRWLDGSCLGEWAPWEVAAHAPSTAEEGPLTGVEVTFEGSTVTVETQVDDLCIPATHQSFDALRQP